MPIPLFSKLTPGRATVHICIIVILLSVSQNEITYKVLWEYRRPNQFFSKWESGKVSHWKWALRDEGKDHSGRQDKTAKRGFVLGTVSTVT